MEGDTGMVPMILLIFMVSHAEHYRAICTNVHVGLGVPFNIVQYSILTHMIAQVTDHVAEEFIWSGGDVHIYSNHVDALKEQLTREPYASPTLKLNPEVKEINDFKYDDFEIVGYDNYHPTIKMEVSV